MTIFLASVSLTIRHIYFYSYKNIVVSDCYCFTNFLYCTMLLVSQFDGNKTFFFFIPDFLYLCFFFRIPDDIALCLLPEVVDTDDVTANIQHKLVEAYCWENEIEVVKVSFHWIKSFIQFLKEGNVTGSFNKNNLFIWSYKCQGMIRKENSHFPA